MKALFLENYWIKKELGRGNFSIVYTAVNSKTGEDVVLKRFLLPPVLLESQRKEKFKVLKEEFEKYFPLKHESIVETYNFFEENSEFYLEAEHLEGENLANIIGNKVIFKLDEGVHVFLKAAEALAYAHSKGLFHKYLKPSNIYINDDGDIKVTDFGTHLFNRDEKEKEITSDAAPPKIISYFSPEQLEGDEYDARSDVYSLAATMYELFTGKPPFEGENKDIIREKILNKEPEQPSVINPNIPELLNYMLMKALNKDPELRHRDMEDLVRDINHLFTSGSVTSTGIRAGEIKKAQGRIAFTFKNLKQKAIELFHKFTGGKEETPQQEKPEKKNKKEEKKPAEPVKNAKTLSYLSDTAPKGIKSRKKHTAILPKIPIPKKKTQHSLFAVFIIVLSLMVLSLFIFKVAGTVLNNMKNKELSSEELESNGEITNGSVDSKTPISSEDSETNGSNQTVNRPTGTVSVSVNVPDAVIYLKNYYDKSIPSIQVRSGTPGYVNDMKVPPGVYSLKIEKEMYSPYERRVEVMIGHRKQVNVKLERKEPRLQVFTEPGGASVILNGSLYGKTPLTLYNVRYGKYRLLIRKKGYDVVRSLVKISPGNPVIINKNLERRSNLGKKKNPVKKIAEKNLAFVSIITDPKGVLVNLDNKKIGLTPINKFRHKPGTYTIVLTKKGFKKVVRKINIPRGLIRDFFFDLAEYSESAEAKGNSIPKPNAIPLPEYPTGKANYGNVRKRLPKEPRTPKKRKIKIVARLRFIPGVAYDKLDRKIITISFDSNSIQKNLETILEKQENIELTEKRYDADLVLTLHFAVGVDTRNASRKPRLTLYSAIMIVNFRTKEVLLNQSRETPLEFPGDASLEMENDGGPSLHSNRFINTDAATPEVNLFILQETKKILKDLKNYAPGKNPNAGFSARDSEFPPEIPNYEIEPQENGDDQLLIEPPPGQNGPGFNRDFSR